MTSSEEETSGGIGGRIGFWAGCLAFLLILLMPTPDGMTPAAKRLAAVTALMAILWLSQALPVAATSLLPLALFPLLGIASAKTVAGSFLSDSSFLYLGGFIIALGIERWGLHRRLALHVVQLTGTTAWGIVWGFMLATFAISMWISNTATTLLMLPIAMALLTSLQSLLATEAGPDSAPDPAFDHFARSVLLGIAYAASIGGVATLVGTPTNIAFVAIWERQFPEGPKISAGQWMSVWAPFGLLFLGVAWLVLVAGMKRPRGFDRFEPDFFRRRLRELGALSRGEGLMLVIFVVTAVLWMTRTDIIITDALRMPGWENLTIPYLTAWGVPASQVKDWVNDSTVAIAVSILMFVIPVTRGAGGERAYLMDWKTTERLPWGILLLFGGGFAIADASRTTHLSDYLGAGFAQVFADQPAWLLILGVAALMTFMSEFTSNVATVNALLPMLAGAAVSLEIDPRLIMIPATIATSCSFMLPIGTPPNAIVYATGRVPMRSMMGYGFVLNWIGILLCWLFSWVMIPMMGIARSGLPAWVGTP